MKVRSLATILTVITLAALLFSLAWQVVRIPYGNMPVNHDPIRGFEVLDQMDRGGKWNHLEYPGTSLDADVSIFLSWWTPGQYSLPAITERFTDRQNSLAIWVILPWVSFLLGIYLLGRNWSVPVPARLLILLMLVWHPETFMGLWEYKGGGALMMGFLPWYVLFLFRLDPAQVRSFWYWGILSVLGVFLKSSFILWALGGGSYILFRLWKTKKLDRRRGLHLLASAVLSFAPIIWFISRGQTPNEAVDPEGFFGMGNHLMADILIPPVLSLFSGWSVAGEIFSLDTFLRSHGWSPFVSLIPIFGLGVAMFMAIRTVVTARIQEFLLIHLFLFWLIFSAWYLSDRAISYEVRHFFPLGVLFMIPIFWWILKKLGSTGHLLILAGILLYGVGQWSGRWVYFSEGFLAGDGIRYPNRYRVGFEALEDVRQKAGEETLILIESNWHYSRAVGPADKVVIGRYRGDWKVNPGVELDVLPEVSEIGFSRYGTIWHLCLDPEKAFRPAGFSEVSRQTLEDGQWIMKWERN
ncbi:MAG: hypothetical protein LPK28_04520 [Bacteroidota bacterium]|nr:hypothetical protein [Bacteroidota bacterium]